MRYVSHGELKKILAVIIEVANLARFRFCSFDLAFSSFGPCKNFGQIVSRTDRAFEVNKTLIFDLLTRINVFYQMNICSTLAVFRFAEKCVGLL